ncbi:hypothetical protein KTO58_26570 [Chitinophaga pendula]|uniref:hypothetical protein n=1 Tax=Chitinophaga TaxID=79328 RepID=UPI000BAFEDD6|nr:MULTISPECIES: hypothetical protein [Chitinophaga]ASZ09872.1 hypothetical protein CK934_02195 [Chitinophaga sp. MD30]UCJ07186.1 hypothetical protein KTO58_26570 [Chitinophaga pendula]
MNTEEEMKEKSMSESGLDIDWYFTDASGKIAIVASAGGMLPDVVVNNMEKLKGMIKYFRSLPVLSNEILIEERVVQEISGHSEEQKKAYLRDVHYMVSRGFYYFDKEVLNNYYDLRYYLKASPIKPLIINRDTDGHLFLPEAIINSNLSDLKAFTVDQIK